MLLRMEQTHRERLVRELAALSEDERCRLVEEAQAMARTRPPAETVAPTLPWSSLRAAIGLAHGATADAVEDCDRLYDG
jgi:hypothetical protein